jgi:hydrogenase maturation protein HypF
MPRGASTRKSPARARLLVQVGGVVQGVGFRPFVYRLAEERALKGWVNNSAQGVSLEVEGPPGALREFLLRLEAEKPPLCSIQSLESRWLDPVGYRTFKILPSSRSGATTALVMPDVATCADCLRELFDLANRRFRYPFTNCTHCGPRYTILERLPYDRPNTSMRRFVMCAQCQAEYDQPTDRRFHAQPNACPICGPHLELWDRTGAVLASHHQALLAAVEAIRDGRIVAVKGLGGFHLMLDAGNEAAVRLLRERKRREEKPFAVMFPSLAGMRQVCQVDELEARLLSSPESPIVLVRRHSAAPGSRSGVADSVAPRNPYLGAMLPYTPLHHLLLTELTCPVVATSGNLSDEPICLDEREALSRLGALADLFLVHDRPILRPVDDSIARIVLGRELLLRRARGYAPLPIRVSSPDLGQGHRNSPELAAAHGESPTPLTGPPADAPILGVGAHLKNTVALRIGPQVHLSQHVGDLETELAFASFKQVVVDLQRLHEAQAVRVAADCHPDYLSTQFARATTLPLVPVQHHYAHVLACMGENELAPPALGVAWDGTGYGLDGTIWGGEFLQVDGGSFWRVAHCRTFRLPGGDRAVKEPRRVALGMLYELLGDTVFDRLELPTLRAFRPDELALLRQSLPKGLNAPLTSSVGRLFDGVASLLDLRQTIRFEGQAAMELEFALEGIETEDCYALALHAPVPDASTEAGTTAQGGGVRPPRFVVDWADLVRGIVADQQAGLSPALISARFHNALAEVIVAVAQAAGQQAVVLTGGCFQNKYLTERAVRRLQDSGFRPYWHQRVPPNDGGVALGQVLAARAADRDERLCV